LPLLSSNPHMCGLYWILQKLCVVLVVPAEVVCRL